jgi:hypothetical protein
LRAGPSKITAPTGTQKLTAFTAKYGYEFADLPSESQGPPAEPCHLADQRAMRKVLPHSALIVAFEGEPYETVEEVLVGEAAGGP